MNDLLSRVLENKMLIKDTYRITLEATSADFSEPGQFAMVTAEDKFLRRPISVSSYDGDRFSLIYRVVGGGTEAISRLEPGDEVKVLTGLGSGYDVRSIPDGAVIIGGGIGAPPMLGLAKSLVVAGKHFRVVLGFNTADEVFLDDEFRMFCDDVTVVTADGSIGERGFVTDVIGHEKYICACGPTPMLKALSKCCDEGQFSLEARMGCGFGACMGCSIRTEDGPKRVCKEGPVFDKRIIRWETL